MLGEEIENFFRVRIRRFLPHFMKHRFCASSREELASLGEDLLLEIGDRRGESVVLREIDVAKSAAHPRRKEIADAYRRNRGRGLGAS